MDNIIITWSVGEIIGLCLLVLFFVVLGISLLGAYILDKIAEFKKRRTDSIAEFEKRRADRKSEVKI